MGGIEPPDSLRKSPPQLTRQGGFLCSANIEPRCPPPQGGRRRETERVFGLARRYHEDPPNVRVIARNLKRHLGAVDRNRFYPADAARARVADNDAIAGLISGKRHLRQLPRTSVINTAVRRCCNNHV